METGTDKVELTTEGHRADVKISRPEKKNAIDRDVISGVHRAFDALDEGEEYEDVRAATLLGEGDSFCAGMDLSMMTNLAASGDDSVGDELHAAFNAIEDCRVPVVAGVKRAGIAGGFELTLPADFRVLGEEADYGPIEVKLGLFPSGGSTQRLPRLVGLARAKEIAMLGDYIEPEEAERMGLVNEVCPDDEVDDRARELADELADRAPLGVQKAKQALNHAGDVPLDDGLQVERYLAKELYSSEDAREGFAARMEGREPEFEGK